MLAILLKIAFLFTILTDFVYYRVKINEFLGIWHAFVHVKILEYLIRKLPRSKLTGHCP